MDIAEFWKVIDSSIERNKDSLNAQVIDCGNELSKYSIEEIREFNYLSETLIEKAKDEKVFETFCKIFNNKILFQGSISWSNYESFIGWLIMQGSGIYTYALEDPNSLKELIKIIYNNDINKCICEDAIFIASAAYEIKTGRNYFEDF